MKALVLFSYVILFPHSLALANFSLEGLASLSGFTNSLKDSHHASVQLERTTFREGLRALKFVWDQRFEMDKEEDQLLISNMQLSSAIRRMTALANNLRSLPNPDETSKAILENTQKIIERYVGYFSENEKRLGQIYSARKRYIQIESLQLELQSLSHCSGWVLQDGAVARLRLEKIHPSDLQKLEAQFEGIEGMGVLTQVSTDHWLTLSQHEGESNFSLPNTAIGHVLVGIDGKAKVLSFANEKTCWKFL